MALARTSFRSESSASLLLGRLPAAILVVDDEDSVRRMLKGLLQPEGFKVKEARSAEEAEEMLPRVAPDVVILDVNMPGKSGHDVLRRLRSDPATRLLPVIMLTGSPTRDSRLTAIEEGVTDFISKPFSPDILLARVKALVRMKRFIDALEDAENVIVALAKTVDARDPYTLHHSERVARIGGRLAVAIGLTGTDLAAVRRGGLFHDIGKIAVRDAVLLKPDRLTPEEFDEIKRHPAEGRRLLQGMKTLAYALDVVTYHHERLDGSGYPEGLGGEAIPLTARVVTIADIYDALTTPRTYRPAMSRDDALEEMAAEVTRGWWDPRLFREFRALPDTEPAAGAPSPTAAS
jgi:putative two-component system response regulator